MGRANALHQGSGISIYQPPASPLDVNREELLAFPDIASPTMALANGSVDPYQAPPSTSFAFRVNLTTSQNGTPDGYRVYLNLTVVRGVNVAQSSYRMAYSPGNFSAGNTRNGSWYEARLSNLTDAVYLYAFSVWDQGKNWTYTTVDFGPLTASGWVYFGFFIYLWSALSQVTIVALLAYFAILFLWWYTKRSREARMKTLARAGDLPKEEKKAGAKPESSSGGKASKVAAFTCTNCGADVDESDTKCPKCGAVFED